LTTTREAFVARLRIAREHAGITLESIAASTKIKQSLLAELENHDVSHWPRGIYRRAFFREYVGAIGMASDALVAEFIRLFPEDDGEIPDLASVTRPEATSELRLSLAGASRPSPGAVLRHVAAAVVDLCLVGSLAGIVSWLIGVEVRTGVAVIALAYYSLATAVTGRTPAVRALTGTRPAGSRMSPVSAKGAQEPLRIVSQADLPRVSMTTDEVSDERPPRLHAVSR
jgi:hypothetical protein